MGSAGGSLCRQGSVYRRVAVKSGRYGDHFLPQLQQDSRIEDQSRVERPFCGPKRLREDVWSLLVVARSMITTHST